MKEVIVAVQTGESDFEMESDTSESSDKKIDEHADPMDEQNLTPIDWPTDDPNNKDFAPRPVLLAEKYFTSPCINFSPNVLPSTHH